MITEVMITEVARLMKSLAALARWVSVLLLIATLACRQEAPTSSVTTTEQNPQIEASNTPSRSERDISGFDL